ncbi:hypothetical protein [Caballeronia sp. PC1]|nr:hypothetical protein [Caballeronia sp. PC1]MCE4543253.1 hypothetical protein [Caballeronia sp. PC1]
MRRIAAASASNSMSLQVKYSPTLAYWFICDTLSLANQANREGMHANALSLTRQCIEAVSVIEVGICNHPDAEAMLLKWDADRATAGEMRKWLQANVWVNYGTGLWNEPWDVFMRELAAAIQPYAHYGRNLAQWQLRFHGSVDIAEDCTAGAEGLMMELRPRAYDAQKATRITLFHGLLTYVLGRVWMSSNPADGHFDALMGRLGKALGASRYLDGHATDWSQQFWATLWERGGGTILE